MSNAQTGLGFTELELTGAAEKSARSSKTVLGFIQSCTKCLLWYTPAESGFLVKQEVHLYLCSTKPQLDSDHHHQH